MAIAEQEPATLTPEGLTTIHYAVNRLIGRFGFTENDREDLEQELALNLLVALKDYNSERAKRSTFIKDCIENRIFNLVRDRRRIRRDPRRVSRIGDGEDDEASSVPASSLVDLQAASEQDRADLRMDLSAVIGALTPRLQEMCALLPDISPYAVSRQLGVSKQSVYRDVEKIRAAFAAAGLADYLGRGREI